MKTLLLLMLGRTFLQLLFYIFSKLVILLKPVNPYSDEMLKNWNPLDLICERYITNGNYIEVIYSNPQHLQEDILYKAIYYVLITDDKFINIEGNKTILIEGLTPTQRSTFSLIFDLNYYHNFNLELFLDIGKDRITLTNYDEHVHCIIIKYKKI